MTRLEQTIIERLDGSISVLTRVRVGTDDQGHRIENTEYACGCLRCTDLTESGPPVWHGCDEHREMVDAVTAAFSQEGER